MTTKLEKREFEITIWYFKPSGKFYTEAKFRREFRNCGTDEHPNCFMGDVTSHIRGLRDCGGQGAMYGLSLFTEGWEGPILVNCDEGYPCLILPSKVEQ